MATDDLMKAAVLDSPNSAFRLAEVTRPKAEAGQLLVRIKASGVNPLDAKIQAGQAPHAG
jgi:NADPH2:quinone reductase